MKLIIKKLDSVNHAPFNLLLLADPSNKLVEEYLCRGICYVAKVDEEIVGVYVLIRTRPDTVEIVNIAVKEDSQGKGIGKKLIFDAIEGFNR
jgi:N-acetylglutamate synthase-like GNAT family acetyltransferase